MQMSRRRTSQYLARADAARKDHDLERALAECDLAIGADSTSAKAFNLRGMILKEMGRKQDAFAAFRQAVSLDPNYWNALGNLKHLETEVADQSVSNDAVALWTPRTIGLIAFILGFPSGTMVAAINWVRMGLKRKALIHLLVALGLLIVLILIPNTDLNWAIGLPVSIAAWMYLKNQMKDDVAKFEVMNGRTRAASGLSGWGIGLGGCALYLAVVYIVTVILILFGIKHL